MRNISRTDRANLRAALAAAREEEAETDQLEQPETESIDIEADEEAELKQIRFDRAKKMREMQSQNRQERRQASWTRSKMIRSESSDDVAVGSEYFFLEGEMVQLKDGALGLVLSTEDNQHGGKVDKNYWVNILCGANITRVPASFLKYPKED